MTDDGFLDRVWPRLAELPGVEAVSLGGSRAVGEHREDSDWDLAIYYRGQFHPDRLRDLGWPGEVSDLGAWGGGVFNGGAWLRVDDRPVDIHYRDLTVVEHELAEAREGRFHVEPLMFHLAGIPSYLVVAELALNRVLHGTLPRPEYPEKLRESAPDVWWGMADFTLTYAEAGHARHGRLTQCLGLVAQATSQAAHAVLAARGIWVTNEKTLLSKAGLDGIDELMAATTPDTLADLVETVRGRCAAAVAAAKAGR